MMSLNSNSQMIFTIKHPLPNINSIEFIDNNTGWAVCNNGYVVKSTDFGNNWNAIILDTSIDISDVYFFDNNTGWLIANMGRIYKTINSGINWSLQFTYSNANLRAIQFVNNSTGFIVGDFSGVLKTTTGGVSWFNLNTNSNRFLKSLSFVNINTGYICGDSGTVLFTSNGGSNWVNQTSNTIFNLNSISFVNSQTGVIAGYKSQDQNVFMIDTSGGNPWYTFQGSGFELYSIKMADPFTIITGGYKFNGSTSALFRSVDQANSWSEIIVQNNKRINSIECINVNNWLYAGDVGTIYSSINGGVNWTVRSGYPMAVGGIVSCSFPDENTGFILTNGGGGYIFKTSTGGDWWSAPYSLGTINNPHSIYFINSQTGWVSADDGIIKKTTDGGNSWGTYNTGGTKLHSVFFINHLTGWTAGGLNTNNGKRIYKSTNGGINWFQQYYTNWGREFYDLYFINSQTGWAAGYQGVNTICKTTNGGEIWYETQAPGLSIYSVYFYDSSIGWAVGEAGTIHKSINGGELWTTLFQPFILTSENITDIYFANQNTGWALTSSLIYKSTNGGMNWNSQLVGTGGGSQFAFPVTSIAYVIGGLSVYKTTNTGSELIPQPVLLFPSNNSSGQSLTPLLDWSNVPIANSYKLQLAVDSFFTMILIDTTTNVDSLIVAAGILNNNVKYFWRVKAMNNLGSGPFSIIFSFRTQLVGMLSENSHTSKFTLHQNYPNPFNPLTKIEFDIPFKGFIKLTLFDVLGREITKLINQEMNPGCYKIDWDASNLPNGIYFYKLEAGSFVETKKMILLK